MDWCPSKDSGFFCLLQISSPHTLCSSAKQQGMAWVRLLKPHLTKITGNQKPYKNPIKRESRVIAVFFCCFFFYSDNLKWTVANRRQVKHLLTRSAPLWQAHYTTVCCVRCGWSKAKKSEFVWTASHFAKEAFENEDNLWMLFFLHRFLSRQGKEPYGRDAPPASTAALLVCINSHICNSICLPANVQAPS